MQLTCELASGLVPAYLDGELTEAQAAPLREHLLGCHACRELAQHGRALQRWFVPEPESAAPTGFAARVARRAFAGDPGQSAVPRIEPVATPSAESADEPAGALLNFVLRMTAVAAAALLFLAAALQLQARPTPADELRADDLDEIWAEIYELEGPAAGTPDGDAALAPRVESDTEPAELRR